MDAPRPASYEEAGDFPASARWYDVRGHQWVISFSVDLVGLSRLVAGALRRRERAGRRPADRRTNCWVRPVTRSSPRRRQSGGPCYRSQQISACMCSIALCCPCGRAPPVRLTHGRPIVSADDSGGTARLAGQRHDVCRGRQPLRIVALAPAADASALLVRRGFVLAALIARYRFVVPCLPANAGKTRAAGVYLFVRPSREKRCEAENQAGTAHTVAAITAAQCSRRRIPMNWLIRRSASCTALWAGQAMFCPCG